MLSSPLILLLLRLTREIFLVLNLALNDLDRAVSAGLALDAHPDLAKAAFEVVR